MTAPTYITVIVDRPLLFLGERVEPGCTLDVPPLAAADLIGSGRASLRREADRPAVMAAVRAEAERVARKTAPRAALLR